MAPPQWPARLELAQNKINHSYVSFFVGKIIIYDTKIIFSFEGNGSGGNI